MKVQVNYKGETLELIVKELKPGLKDLNNHFECLSLTNSESDEKKQIYFIDSFTILKISNAFEEVKLSDIGGLEKQIDNLLELLLLPIKKESNLVNLRLRPPRGILLFGVSGVGKSMTVKAIMNHVCNKLHCITVEISSLLCKNISDSEENLKTIFDEAIEQAPSLVCVDSIDLIFSTKRSNVNDSEKRLIALLAALLESLPEDKHIVVIGVTNKVDFIDLNLRRAGRFEKEIEFSVPSPKEREQILKKILNKINHSVSEETISAVTESSHSFTGADLFLACREASLLALKSDQNEVSSDLLIRSMKCVRPSAMKEITLEVPKVYWTDIGGMSDVKKRLTQSVVWPLKAPEAFKKLGINPPSGILLYGPPGCSKTMIGKALATESGLNFIAVKGPELFNKWVGESERGVREVFRKARQAAPSILFFDEIDALAVERGAGQSTVGDRVLAQLLTELDGIEKLDGVTLIAATNRPDMIDKALMRPGRLDSIIYVPLPNFETRKEIIDIRTRNMPLDFEKVPALERLAGLTEGFSGAEIAAVCQEAGLTALEEDLNCEKVKLEHFTKALQKIKPRTPASLIELYETYS